MQDSFDCELQVFTQDTIKRIAGKRIRMNNVTCDHTPLARMLACDPKCARVIDIMHARSTCMHVRTAIDR